MAKIGRPAKIEAFTLALMEVLDEPVGVGAAIMYSQKELMIMTNDRLSKEDKICASTLVKWVGNKLPIDEYSEVFLPLYEKALIVQKRALFQLMREEPAGAWQKWAWVIERKFPEFNLRNITVDETPDVKKLVFLVEGSAEPD